MKRVSQIATEVFLQIAQGRESVTFNIATSKQTNMTQIPTHTNSTDPKLLPLKSLSREFLLSMSFN